MFFAFLAQGVNGAVVSLLTFSTIISAEQILCHSVNFASLPITFTLVGSFLAILFHAKIAQKIGRKWLFCAACVAGMVGALVAAFALFHSLFSLFCVGTFLLGVFTSLNLYYRFLAKNSAFVIGGGVIGAVLGPNLAFLGSEIFSVKFVGSFGFAFLLCFVNLVLNFFVKFEPVLTQNETKSLDKNDNAVWKNKIFVASSLACGFGFGLMTLNMNALPLASTDLAMTKSVLVAHFLAMYLPSFVISACKFSPKTLIFSGFFLYICAALVAVSANNFYVVLVLVGVAWSLSFNGGTQMLSRANLPAKTRLQSLNSLITFGLNLAANLSIGFIFGLPNPWVFLNLIMAFFSVVALLCVWWLARVR